MAQKDYAAPAPKRPQFFTPLLVGVTTIALFFGGFGAWAVVTPIASAAYGSGQVRVEGRRKTVEHLEGGIVREIMVKEGDYVEEGQVLLRLDDVQASAMSELLESQLQSLRAAEARLMAERSGAEEITFPQSLLNARDNPRVEIAISGQTSIFENRRLSLEGRTDLLEQKIGQLKSQIQAHTAQRDSAERQILIVQEELKTVRDLTKRGFEKRPRLLALERELAQLRGERGEQVGMIASAEQSISEAKLQIVDLKNTRRDEVSAELQQTRTKISELTDRLTAASDVETRTAIVAPISGRIVQLQQVTTGGVVKPGEPILDIVPSDVELVIDARISPLDIDSVHTGLEAEIKLMAFKQRSLPILLGTVTSVSADALTDERSGTSYYTAEVRFTEEQRKMLQGLELYPGMPADVLVLTGERTPLEYFIEPIEDSFNKAFREQ
ncbi:HlyD family type I secretion periplasmic adaptor subunit [Jiella marina]|uniref:HlyD family type I secretion periplasmic adaptor subunit n=1 Tax=Jiella sp. LLJ827 TaxID=2917712 RepID=UPI002101A586|nr:HlyD family type I secretion periplasmic adaptor subunit [Jiella sp. LLJ827]MCQ0988465.1 HlyD family type I secretion periplasmic adaptor subunit [Jiella sp. LLJ827]